MESLKKKKATQRTAFTKALNALNGLRSANNSDKSEVSSAFQMLKDKMGALDETMSKIYEIMFADNEVTEDQIEKESEEADDYKRKFYNIKHQIEDSEAAAQADRLAERSRSATPVVVNAPNVQQGIKSTFKLPTIEFVKFNGDVTEWFAFWSLYKKVHEDKQIKNEEKFIYLNQAMVPDSRAYKLVKSFPPCDENYDKVIAALKNRFGRDDLQVEVYVRKLLQLVLNNAIRQTSRKLLGAEAKIPEVDLSTLYDELESHLRALETLGVTTDKCAAMLLPMVESSLPEEVLRAWQRSFTGLAPNGDQQVGSDLQSKDRLTRLVSFIGGEVQNEMRISMAMKGFDFGTSEVVKVTHKKDNATSGKSDVPSAMGLLAAEGRLNLCVFCESSDHKSANCPAARKMSIGEKEARCLPKRACYRCLIVGHMSRKCRVNVRCEQCNGKHVTVMCDKEKGGSERANVVNANSNPSTNVEKECNLASLSGQSSVFMQVLSLRLRGKNGEKLVRALIDSGSQRSYLTKAAAAEMGYEPIGEQRMCHLVIGGNTTDTVIHKKYLIRLGSVDHKYACNFEVLDQQSICGRIPPISKGDWCNELRDLQIELTDYCDSDTPISVLIGADVAGKLITGKRVQLTCGLVAVETLLGWTVMGKVQSKKKDDAVMSALALHVANCNVEDLWALDTLGIKDPLARKSKKQQQQDVCDEFLRKVKVNEEGRYEVPLPWLEAHPPLSDNKAVSDRRIPSLVKKLKAEGLYEAYDAVFDEWRAEGVIEFVPTDADEDSGHFLPHRHVVKENSTTKIRPVFDASAKQPPHPSLNECLEKGPNFIELITDILLRFRACSIGVIADIKKAFLQISVDPKDRDFLRFLWFDKFGRSVILRHCRVVFGVCSSPFILAAVIKLHLEKILERLSDGLPLDFSRENILKLMNSFYVDNCVTSVNTVDQLNSFIAEAKSAMESAKFDLRGWEYSNDLSREDLTAVLGMVWDKQRDVLRLNTTILENARFEKVTKRVMLSLVHRVFDPFGFVCPITLTPRLLLQDTWSKNLWWDDPVDESVSKRFEKWVEELKFLDKVQVPRCLIGEIDENCKITLHTFCDASKIAYAAVVFLQIERAGDISVRFVQAKARIAPIRGENEPQHSMPRMELLAAGIGVRLTVSIVEAMDLKNVDLIYWSDSSTVLAWIHREINWGVFVFNRVKEIRAFSKKEQWRHVPGHLNPANLPSRGCTVSQLLESQWWEGPQWLRDPRSWPVSNFTCDEDEINREMRKTAIKENVDPLVCLLNHSEEEAPWYLNRYSSYIKLLRVLAWIKRFGFNCKSPLSRRKGRQLLCKELIETEQILVELIQLKHFDNLDDERIAHLKPFHDGSGLVRLKTKILMRDDTFNFRCPMILPENSEIVDLIIRDHHTRANHAGVQITLSILREKFWILGGRKTIRSAIRKCVECRRQDAQPLEMTPAPLPLERIREAAVFEIIGVDFAGPVYLKGGQKAWICIFTCAVFRAVHLDLVTSLSVSSFLMALSRHISRRGRPSVIFSDNGTNFSGLNNEKSGLGKNSRRRGA